MAYETTITASEFKAKCLDLLDQLATRRLTRLSVTKRGRIVAVVTPPTKRVISSRYMGSCAVASWRPTDLTSPPPRWTNHCPLTKDIFTSEGSGATPCCVARHLCRDLSREWRPHGRTRSGCDRPGGARGRRLNLADLGLGNRPAQQARTPEHCPLPARSQDVVRPPSRRPHDRSGRVHARYRD